MDQSTHMRHAGWYFFRNLILIVGGLLLLPAAVSQVRAHERGAIQLAIQPASTAAFLPAALRVPAAAATLQLDDGTREHAAGYVNDNTEYAAIWLNRFTPSAGSYPLVVQTIAVFWPSNANGTVVGKRARLLVYWDAQGTGDPSRAVLIGQQLITIGAIERFETYPVNLTIAGPGGDVYIGFEDLWAESGYAPYLYPAPVDTGQPHGRSWFIGNSNYAAPDVTHLGNNDALETLDSLGLPGNLMIRANTQGGGPGPTATPPPSNGRPSAPSNLHVTGVSQNSVAIAWTDTANNEQHFNIYRADNGGSFRYINSTHANATSYLQANLNCGTAYTYQVTAANDAGESAAVQVDARTDACPGAQVPNPPKNLRVSSVTANSIALAWDDDSTNEQHFNVYRADNGGSFRYINSTHANAISYLQTNLNCGTAYAYRITAANEAGESAAAQVATQTSACPVSGPTPTPFVPRANIAVTAISWLAPPQAYLPATLIIRGQATTLPPGSGAFRVRVLVDAGFFSRPLSFWYNTADAYFAKYVSPMTITNGNFEIRISGLSLPRIVGGRIAAWVISDDNVDLQGATTEGLDVATSPAGGQACFDGIYAVLMSGLSLLPDDVVDRALTKPVHDMIGDMDTAAGFTRANLDATANITDCRGDPECQQARLDEWSTELRLQLLDKVAEGGGFFRLGVVAVALKDLVLAGPDVINCGAWVSYGLASLAKQFNQQGWFSNFFGTGSPVYPYITDSAGHRAGFLPTGQQVSDIPGAVVFAVGESRFILYPSQDSGVGTITGYAAGTMSVNAVFARSSANRGGAVHVAYHDLPVAPGMVGTLSSNDAQTMVTLDLNHDGTVDQAHSPDTRELIAGANPAPSHTFAETGKTVSGRFWDVWQGGHSYDDSLYINGLPLTDQHAEVSLTDGKIYQVQWFERARFEAHPENQAPYDVLLGLLGVQAAQGRQEPAFAAVGNPQNGLPWFAPTGHTLGDSSAGGQAIARFWNQLGGLAQFGYPLSQPFTEVNQGNGKPYLVQYFERQRFEYHPENQGTRYEVLLGRLGAEQQNGGAGAGGTGVGPLSGQLVQRGADTQAAGVRLRDFVAVVRLYNPTTAATHPWDAALSFRISPSGSYSLLVDSSRQWTLFGTGGTAAPHGTMPNLNVAAGGANTYKIVATGPAGDFWVNDQHVAHWDLAANQSAGDVSIRAGILDVNVVPGAVVRYDDFTVQPSP